MTLLIAGLLVFLGVHSVSIVALALRDRAVAAIGKAAWQGIYSVIAAVGLVLIVIGYGAARTDPVLVYQPPLVLRYLAILLMVPVFPLLLAAYLPGRIRTTLKHPMLVAVKLWAAAHLLANGSLADVLLFGAFLVWAAADRASLRRRPARDVPALRAGPYNDAIAVVGGVVLYVAFFGGAHRWVTGMPLVLPW